MAATGSGASAARGFSGDRAGSAGTFEGSLGPRARGLAGAAGDRPAVDSALAACDGSAPGSAASASLLAARSTCAAGADAAPTLVTAGSCLSRDVLAAHSRQELRLASEARDHLALYGRSWQQGLDRDGGAAVERLAGPDLADSAGAEPPFDDVAASHLRPRSELHLRRLSRRAANHERELEAPRGSVKIPRLPAQLGVRSIEALEVFDEHDPGKSQTWEVHDGHLGAGRFAITFDLARGQHEPRVARDQAQPFVDVPPQDQVLSLIHI